MTRPSLITILLVSVLASAAAKAATLVDSQNAIVGPVDLDAFYLGQTVAVPFKVDGRRVLLRANRFGFLKGYLAFASRDCTGQPYLFTTKGALTAAASVGPPGSTLYLRDPMIKSKQFEGSSSYRFDDATNSWLCQGTFAGRGLAAPAIQSVDLSIFTPPFKLRLPSDAVNLTP